MSESLSFRPCSHPSPVALRLVLGVPRVLLAASRPVAVGSVAYRIFVFQARPEGANNPSETRAYYSAEDESFGRRPGCWLPATLGSARSRPPASLREQSKRKGSDARVGLWVWLPP
jgi:hypothetical protein